MSIKRIFGRSKQRQELVKNIESNVLLFNKQASTLWNRSFKAVILSIISRERNKQRGGWPMISRRQLERRMQQDRTREK